MIGRVLKIAVIGVLCGVNACDADEVGQRPDEPAAVNVAAVDQPAPPAKGIALGSPSSEGTLEDLGEWRGHFDGRRLTFIPVDEAARSSGIRPKNFQEVPEAKLSFTTDESIVVNSGADDPSKAQCITNHNEDTGNPRTYYGTSAGSQQLTTGGGPCQNQHLCANVSLQNLTTRTLDNVYVELGSFTPVVAATPFKADNSVTTSPDAFGLSNTDGLFSYSTLTSNQLSATQRWNIFLPDCRDFDFTVKVKGTVRPTAYTQTGLTNLSASDPFLNACSTAGRTLPAGTDPNENAVSGNITLPFPFTLYDRTFGSGVSSIRVSADGRVGFSLTNASGSNGALGASTATSTLYPYWDRLNPGENGLCAVTMGSAPNRKYVVTWNDARLSGFELVTERLTFSVVLEESTDAIEFQYNRWSEDSFFGNGCSPGTTTRGGGATVGIQGATSAIVATSFNAAFLPTNGCPAAGLGVKYRYTPNPAVTVF
jgi:hypothetical protein